MAMAGQIDDALELLDQQIEQVERPGWEEKVDYAEILRIKGWIRALESKPDSAKECYVKANPLKRSTTLKLAW